MVRAEEYACGRETEGEGKMIIKTETEVTIEQRQ